jgi:hypothetical protein
MKCPFCNKTIDITSDELDHLMCCPFCSRRFWSDLNIVDFLKKNAELFSIFGIFTAVAVILPTFSQYSKDILINSTMSNGFFVPPLANRLFLLNLLTYVFVLGCGMMILLIGTMIISELFTERRQELIYWSNKHMTVRTNDHVRFMFMFPFGLLFLSLIMYIAIISGDFFQYYMIINGIFFGIVLFLIYRGSPSLFKKDVMLKKGD